MDATAAVTSLWEKSRDGKKLKKKKKLTSCYQRDCASGSCVMHTCVLWSRARQAALFVPQTLLFPPQTCKHAPIWSVAETIYLDFGLIFFFFCCHFPYVIRTMFPSAGLARLFTLMRCPPPAHRVVRREAVLQRHGSSRRAKWGHACRARAKPNPRTWKVIGRLAGAARSRWERVWPFLIGGLLLRLG